MIWWAENSAGESSFLTDGINKRLFSGIYKNMSIIFHKSGNHIRFLGARVGGKPVDWTLLILRSIARMEARRAARSGNALCASWVKF